MTAKSVDPHSLDDPAALRGLMKNAVRLNRPDLALACKVRIAYLEGQKFDDPLEREFWAAVAAAEEISTEKNRRTTKLSRTRQKEKRVGVKQCLIDWACAPGVTQGFTILVEGGHPELTGEAIILRHQDLFDDEVVSHAAEKLRSHGVELARLKD